MSEQSSLNPSSPKQDDAFLNAQPMPSSPKYGDVESAASVTDPLLPRENSGNDDSHGLSTTRAYFTIGTLTLLTVVGSMSTGVLNISLPRIQDDLDIPEGFVLWPASIYSLVCGCCLLLAGSIADFVGSRIINLLGTFVLAVSLMTAGLSQDSTQMIASRGAQGLGVSMCFPTAISILSHTFPTGRIRSIGFAFLGLGQPLGFSLGLVMGGVFETLYGGWRSGFYLSGGIIIVLTLANMWLLPKPQDRKKKLSFRRMRHDIDWLGVLISSACLGILSYILAVITDDLERIKDPENLTMLIISLLLIPMFIYWMHYRQKNGKRALIPNYLWKNLEFSSICFMVMLSWGVIESMDLFFSLFYQNVQHLSPLEASVRFLPSAIIGVGLNVFMGFLVHRFPMGRIVLLCSVLCIGSPLLMAVIDPSWSYWVDAFWASALGPLACDAIFTVANLITTKVFPEDTQSLAGAVFNTIAQFGASMGIAAMAVVNSTVPKLRAPLRGDEEDILMVGYRAVFWACTALMVVVCIVGAAGLRRLGKA